MTTQSYKSISFTSIKAKTTKAETLIMWFMKCRIHYSNEVPLEVNTSRHHLMGLSIDC